MRQRLALLLLSLLAAGAIGACGSDQESVTVSGSEGDAAPEPERAESAAEAAAVTRNTTRIDSGDPVEVAAEVALATHPRFKGSPPVEAVAVVGTGDWQAGLAASVLAGEPLRAPLLLSEPGSVPDATADAFERLAPEGGSGPADSAAYAIGEVAVPEGVDATEIEGGDPAAIAAAVAQLRRRLTGSAPAHIVLVSDADPAFAMPAAAWAARSGDPVLFVGKDSVPGPTTEELRDNAGAAVYLLGPESAASEKVLREVQRVAPDARRIGGSDPVANAIEFARYADASFGWNLNDPGHGLVIGNAGRSADAGAAASLSASGTYGPLLLLEEATELPPALRQFLLDIKPGYRDDPTRALYNRVWLVGDASAISGEVQAEIDEIAELALIGGGSGGTGQAGGVAPLPTGPARPEQEPSPDQIQDQATGKDK